MKARIFVGGIILVGMLDTSGQAADLPYRMGAPTAPIVAPIFTWTGFYIGASVGGAFAGSDQLGIDCGAFTTTFSNGCTPINAGRNHNLGEASPSGIFGGGVVGYNWQISNVVVGVSGDLFASSMQGKDPEPMGTIVGGAEQGKFGARNSADWFGSARLRLGWAIDRWLPYVTAGVALGGFDSRTWAQQFGDIGFIRQDKTQVGWALGGGIEYAVTDHVTLNVEYRYSAFGKQRQCGALVGGPNAGLGSVCTNFTPNWHAVSTGINYKF